MLHGIHAICSNIAQLMLELKSSIFWDITPCTASKVKWYFRGAYYLHFQCQRISQSSACHLLSCWFLAWLILWPWRWRHCALPKCRLFLNGLHGIISQKLELIITTAVRSQILHNAGFVGRLAQFTAEHTVAWWDSLPCHWLNTDITHPTGLKKAMEPLQLKKLKAISKLLHCVALVVLSTWCHSYETQWVVFVTLKC
jgi:hypothetical protein